MARPFISIIIPAFNEEAHIIPTLEKVVDYLSHQPYSWEVLVVDNGSFDDTGDMVRHWAPAHQGVRYESIARGGKGWAVRHGMLAAVGEYRFMCDADLAMPIEGLEAFLERMDEGYDIVIGSRQVAGARRFNEPMWRHVMGRVFNRCARLLAVGGFEDTQCGFKCFRGEAADQLFQLQRTKGFAFDVEILYLALKRGLRVLEMPIDWLHRRESKVRASVDTFLMLRHTMLVRWHDLRRRYDPGPGVERRAAASEVITEGMRQDGQPTPDVEPPPGGLVAVVVPTYNEATNLPELAERLFGLPIPNVRLIVVDDNSPDGTAQVAKELAKRFDGRLEIIQRKGRQGLGTAYVEGFARALAEGADYVVQMDADLSHTPEYIPGLLQTLKRADVVVGSRYVSGGGVDGRWSFQRRLLSYLANLGIRTVGGLRVKDVTSGFKAYRVGALRQIEPTQFQCKGFGFQAEVAHACQRQGQRVIEYPIVFVDRTKGRSKMSLFIVLEAFWRLLLLRWR